MGISELTESGSICRQSLALLIIRVIDKGAVGKPGFGAAQLFMMMRPEVLPEAGTKIARGGPLPAGAL